MFAGCTNTVIVVTVVTLKLGGVCAATKTAEAERAVRNVVIFILSRVVSVPNSFDSV